MGDFPELVESSPVGVLTPQWAIPEYPILLASGISNTAWPVANKAIFIPVTIDEPVTVYSFSFQTGSVITGNIDFGIYDFAGNRLVSSGSTSLPTATAYQNVDVTDTLLTPGYYFMAAAMDANTPNIMAGPPSAIVMACYGLCEMTSAFPLPSTATFARLSSAYVPHMTAHLKSVN